jgi:cysteinyl-tRNA synthetase
MYESSDAFLQYGASLSDDEIEAQIQQRNEARKANDFQKADQIRDDLAEQGILLDDSTEGTTWKKS